MKLSKENRFATALCALAEQTIYSTLLSIFNKQIEKIGKFTFVGSFVDDDSSDIGSEDFSSMQCFELFPKMQVISKENQDDSIDKSAPSHTFPCKFLSVSRISLHHLSNFSTALGDDAIL